MVRILIMAETCSKNLVRTDTRLIISQASLVTCAITGVSWVLCTACASLMGACCGNDKPSTVPPGVSSGRKRSVLLLVLTIALSLAFQYGVAPAIMDAPYLPFFTTYIQNPWLSGCDYDDYEIVKACVGNNGVYRPSFAALVFFLVGAVAVACKPTFNREVWPAKYVLFFFMVLGTVFIPNDPLLDDVFLNIARGKSQCSILLYWRTSPYHLQLTRHVYCHT
jgi:hypothetical protein